MGLVGVDVMVNEGKGRLFRRKDGKYLIYVPLDLAQDSMFPFKDYKKTKRGTDFIIVKVSFKLGDDKLIIEKWQEPKQQ
jgi:hypothetical protein